MFAQGPLGALLGKECSPGSLLFVVSGGRRPHWSVCLFQHSFLGKLWLPEASVDSKSRVQKHRREHCLARTVGRHSALSPEAGPGVLVLQPEEQTGGQGL